MKQLETANQVKGCVKQMTRTTEYISQRAGTCHVGTFISWYVIVPVQFNHRGLCV